MRRLMLACAAAAWPSAAAHAHHSPAAYDPTREVVVSGTVVEALWKNPHSYLTLEVDGGNGESALQEIELDGPSVVQASGLTREVVSRGAQVTVRALPNRRGPGRIVQGIDLTTADGEVYPLGPRGRSTARPDPTVRAESIAGKWAPSYEGFRALGQAIMSGPLTAEAQAARADTESVLALAAGCTPAYPEPVLMAVPVLRTIEVAEDSVVIDVDLMGTRRVVHLDQPHPDELEPSLLGHSMGWWEGDTLVIDTVGFAPHRQGIAFGVPSGPGKHLVERLTLSADGLRLEYAFTLEDRDYLEGPITHAQVWDHRPDLEPTEACDPEIARRFMEERSP